jgi:ribonuclease R
MNFSIAALLANFTEDRSVTLKTLQKKLHCNDEDSQREYKSPSMP